MSRSSLFFVLIAILLCQSVFGVISGAEAKECDGSDLPGNSELRVGVKHKPEVCNRKTARGDVLSMHYTGKLYKDCSKFDSSLDRGTPFQFTLGEGRVIKVSFFDFFLFFLFFSFVFRARSDCADSVSGLGPGFGGYVRGREEEAHDPERSGETIKEKIKNKR